MTINRRTGIFCLALGSVLLLNVEALFAGSNVSTSWTSQTLYKGSKGGVLTTVEFSPDGKLLAAGVGGGYSPQGRPLPGEVKVWDVATGKLRFTLKGHKSYVAGLAFTPDGKRLISLDPEGFVKHWDTASGKSLGSYRLALADVVTVGFSPDRKTLAT